MPFTQFTNLDYDQIKTQIKDHLRANSNFTDFDFEGSNFSVLIDTLAYNTYLTAFNSNMVVNESFLDGATVRENVVSLARNIGYVPRSRTSARADITFEAKLPGNHAYVTLQAGLVCIGQAENTTYSFAIPENITTTTTTSIENGQTYSTAKFGSASSPVSIYQGTYLTKQWIVNTAQDQRFILDNPSIDTSTLSVFVKGVNDVGFGREYHKVDNILKLNKNSEIFLMQEVQDEKYELLFGDGFFGKKLDNNAVITARYIITDGENGNGAAFFDFQGNFFTGTEETASQKRIIPEDNIIVTTVRSASGGSAIENLSSIKYFAPRLYSSQHRAVTGRDYEAIVQKIFPMTESVSVIGGEELDPPEYGTVILSIKPRNSTYLSDFSKTQILDRLKSYSIAGINQRIVDLKVLYIELDVTAYYNSNVFSDSEGLKAQIIDSLTTYGKSTNLNAFGGRFKYSESQRIIDDTNNAFTSNILRLTIRRDLKPVFNAFTQYELCFGNAFHVNPKGKNIKSTGFTIEGSQDTVYFTDLPHADGKTGDIAVIKLSELSGEDPPVVVPSAGSVDYVKGEIMINTINITGTSRASGVVEIQAYPESNDIIGLKDLFLQLDMSNTRINIVRDTISSGQQISGIGYKVTSSYSNGSIIRS